MIFNFHNISFKVSGDKFVDNIRTNPVYFYIILFFIILKYKIVSLDNYDSNKSAVITFDDGDSSIANHLKILNFLRIPFAVFLNNHTSSSPDHFRKFCFLRSNNLVSFNFNLLRGAVNKSDYQFYSNLIDSCNIPDVIKYLDISSLQQLSYCSVGLHGASHSRFNFLGIEDQILELKRNLLYLNSFPGIKIVNYFAIPYGTNIDYNDATFIACKSLNLTILFSNNPVSDYRGINRISLDSPRFTTFIRNLLKILLL